MKTILSISGIALAAILVAAVAPLVGNNVFATDNTAVASNSNTNVNSNTATSGSSSSSSSSNTNTNVVTSSNSNTNTQTQTANQCIQALQALGLCQSPITVNLPPR